MATKEKKGGDAAKGGANKGGGPKPAKSETKKKKGAEVKVARGPHAGAGKPVPAPRLKDYYEKTVRGRLSEQFSLTNPHQIPTMTKIVLNVGAGEAIKQPKFLDNIVEELATITGQQPVRRKAKKSIANYGLREGQEIGASVTLRGARMWEFLDRFVTIALPRVRDFRGVSTKSFDGRGNYSLGVKEQLIFPEINYDSIESTHGMDITFVTTAPGDDLAFALLKELGMPFRGNDKTGARL
ncbi:MAG: Ribosomal protein [Gemmatimonadetes bacterium]|jgi:large subunit ribosomal protein L5|nr:Ribosomal protein [Gemmatimonadota bacterium]